MDDRAISVIRRDADAYRPFLALKYGAPALGITNPAKGKTIPGGSIVLTASGEHLPL
jgi:hypothetical protein